MKIPKPISRRVFLRSATALGLGLAAGRHVSASADAKGPAGSDGSVSKAVPGRPFGSSGVKISQLGLGCAFDTLNNRLLLRQALRAGVSYWDTGTSYGYGNSELGIGRFFNQYPDQRSKVFLSTKTQLALPQGLTWALEKSLERLQTSYVDFYGIHAVSALDEFDEGLKNWVRQAKKDGKIRYFGFTTHKNMQQCMLAAARLGWIDGIMMSYNYRLMQLKTMRQAVSACQNAGIALIAMKTQAVGSESLVGKKQTQYEQGLQPFLDKGITPYQAKLQAVWQNEAISCICSHMPNMTILNANVAAAVDHSEMSRLDIDRLTKYGQDTRSSYCAGCGDICEQAVNPTLPIADVMRHLMYERSYEDTERTRRFIRRLSPEIARQMKETDFSNAEKRCPQQVAIGRLMKEAMGMG